MNTNHTPTVADTRSGRPALRAWNTAAGLAHAVQATAMVLLANDVALPVTGVFASGPPGKPSHPPAVDHLFSYPLGYAVAAFSALSALFHFAVATPFGYRRYQAELARGRNRFRWIEYSLSASLMIVLIAGITGITDIAALIALFAVNAAMILFGWLMETSNPARPATTWTPFVFGCIAGGAPWIAILVYLAGAANPPGFVYGIYVTIFLLFNCFAITQALQYRARGRWADYLHGERAYIILSLLAKSLLAWQIYANILIT